ncbi:MAG: Hsp20/alpha crystallin family protein [Planctomycetaceae bacterium]
MEPAAAPRWFCTPPIDIFHGGRAGAPQADFGVTADDLELQVEDNRLTLLGKVTPPAPPDARLIYQSIASAISRSFILSDDVDHERITAKLNEGVLEVTLPRATTSQPRRIQIRTT